MYSGSLGSLGFEDFILSLSVNDFFASIIWLARSTQRTRSEIFLGASDTLRKDTISSLGVLELLCTECSTVVLGNWILSSNTCSSSIETTIFPISLSVLRCRVIVSLLTVFSSY